MKSFFALLGRILSVISLALGGILFSAWVVAAICGLVVFLAAAIVCALPLCIGVLIQNWADRLEGKSSGFPSLDLTRFAGMLKTVDGDD